jgi:hypothetical protein
VIDLQLPADVGDQFLGPVHVSGLDHDAMALGDREMGRPTTSVRLEHRGRYSRPLEILSDSDRLGDERHTGQLDEGLFLTCHGFIIVIDRRPPDIKPLFPDL